MNNLDKLKKFYSGKKVLITGHTGFKGSWLCALLSILGAEVYGYALPAPTEPSLFEIMFGPGSSKESRKDLKLILDDVSAEASPGNSGDACGAGAGKEETPAGDKGKTEKDVFRSAIKTPVEICVRESCIGDIRDYEKLKTYVNHVRPDVIIHMAAQPIVRESYRIPRETFEANVMGTVNILEALRNYREELTEGTVRNSAQDTVKNPALTGTGLKAGKSGQDASPEDKAEAPSAGKERTSAPGTSEIRVSFLNVTTDKVYRNEEKRDYAYKEEDRLDGYDPYSNSKSCSELATHSYRSAFFGDAAANLDADGGHIVRISTARAGNVIGGGDFAPDRLIPDCMRAYLRGEGVIVRNPASTRPFQHVLEPLNVYLELAMEQYLDDAYEGSYNVGPDLSDCVTSGELCDLFAKYAPGFFWETKAEKNAPHEANFLRLDNTKIKETFGWQPRWHIAGAVEASVRWCEACRRGAPQANAELLRQLRRYYSN